MAKCIQCDVPINDPLTFLNFYLPPRQLCSSCQQAWEEVRINSSEHRCHRCLKRLSEQESICLDCQFLQRHFTLMDQLYCHYNYQGIMKDTLHKYKFMKDHRLCLVLAQLLVLPKTSYDLVIPIPSPLSRDKGRTFNPVEEVLKMKQIPYIKVLGTKIRPKQSALNKRERIEATNPFYIKQSCDLTNKEILLIDDIYTTGLTIHHARCKLSELNFRKFKVFAFAR